MTTQNIKNLLDACYQAKRVRELLPALPEGVTSSFIQFLDVIEHLQQCGMQVKVSDISDALNIPRPGVTRTIKSMESQGYLVKNISKEDGRVTYITMTDAGRRLSQTYNSQFFAQLAPSLEEISEEEVSTTIRTIEKLYRVMSERRISLEYR